MTKEKKVTETKKVQSKVVEPVITGTKEVQKGEEIKGEVFIVEVATGKKWKCEANNAREFVNQSPKGAYKIMRK